MARSKYSRRKAKRGLLQTTALIAGIVFVPIVGLGGGGVLAYRHLNTEQIDANACYARPDQYQAAVFVDFSFTGDTSGSQQRDLRNALLQAYDALPANGAISVFTTQNNTTATVNEPDFVICKPARNPAEQERIGAPAVSAPKLSRLSDETHDRFKGYVADLIAGSQQSDNQAVNSPILEQLQGVSRYNLGSPISKLIIYSDGLNNSPAGQFCVQQGELPRFASFAERPGYAFVRPDGLNGAEVEFLMVEFGTLPMTTLPYCTTQELRSFWVDYFNANGAGAVNLLPLSYGAGN